MIQPFAAESVSKQAELTISWIIGEKYHESMLTNGKKLNDAPICNGFKILRGLPNKSKLHRFVDANLSLIEPYLSEQVYGVFTKIQKSARKINSIAWACMKCNVVFGNDCRSWSCERCLLWFHRECQNTYPREEKPKHIYCEECYVE